MKPGWWNPMRRCKMKRWLAQAVLERVYSRVAFCLIQKTSRVLGFQQDKPHYSHYSWIQTQVHPKVSSLSFVTGKVSQLCPKLQLWKKYNLNFLKYLFYNKISKRLQTIYLLLLLFTWKDYKITGYIVNLIQVNTPSSLSVVYVFFLASIIWVFNHVLNLTFCSNITSCLHIKKLWF